MLKDISVLTRTEKLVFRKLLENKPLSEIAKELHLSVETIRCHAQVIYEKFHITGLNRRFQLLYRWSREQFKYIRNQYEKVVEQNKSLQQDLKECQSDYKEAMKQLMTEIKSQKGKE